MKVHREPDTTPPPNNHPGIGLAQELVRIAACVKASLKSYDHASLDIKAVSVLSMATISFERPNKMRVWFNKGLSNTYDALRLMRAEDRDGRLTLRTTVTRFPTALSTVADEIGPEPRSLSDDAYVAWCLEECAQARVDVFMPQHRRDLLAEARECFEAQGTRLSVMGDGAALKRAEQKDALYEDLAGSPIPVPAWRRFCTLDEFEAAWADLGGANARLCLKPCVSVYGAGFRRLETEGSEYGRLLSGATDRIGVDAFRSALAASHQRRPMMLMTYLPGVERSVDVLAHEGSIVCAVARVKKGNVQFLETTGPSVTLADTLTRRYHLHGVFNVQTKEGNDGVPYLLEINSRMSGGLLYSCQSGVVFPYWAALLAGGLATPADVPQPRAGLCVAPVQECRVVPA
ncbi:ATP-grasp domain-containing protein [Pararhodospirillum oryzae]|uniref:ATP-grasp domain-containing protein n=1 Tax=Pararhodospirillum oryzae TaxID=478448 RepID=A0A512H5R4_9PROT|nr:ATP-grasp domain-containing protein [Pararhodospirillum oryzae]GEO80720.1 hypothetical protein ROR02_08510 [Pararhodospirillum oryzae]